MVHWCVYRRRIVNQSHDSESTRRYTGFAPGEACASRDLVLDLWTALDKRGLKLLLWVPLPISVSLPSLRGRLSHLPFAWVKNASFFHTL